MTVRRNVPRFCMRSICGWNLFHYMPQSKFDVISWFLSSYGFANTRKRPKSRTLPPNLNNNWMTAVIGLSRHVSCWTTLWMVGGRIQDLDQCPDGSFSPVVLQLRSFANCAESDVKQYSLTLLEHKPSPQVLDEHHTNARQICQAIYFLLR